MSAQLDRHLHELRLSVAALEPPAEVDAAIGAAIRSKPAPLRLASRTPRSGLGARLAGLLALAASVLFVAFVQRELFPSGVLDGGSPRSHAAKAGVPFLPVVPMSELSQIDQALVVSARVSRMTLAQFGIPINPALTTDGVDTELLVRPDGAVLAVRFVE